MFPQREFSIKAFEPIFLDSYELVSKHVETIVLLSQQKPSDKIEVNLDLDEFDATSEEMKATYNEIQQYVLKETGLMV